MCIIYIYMYIDICMYTHTYFLFRVLASHGSVLAPAPQEFRSIFSTMKHDQSNAMTLESKNNQSSPGVIRPFSSEHWQNLVCKALSWCKAMPA